MAVNKVNLANGETLVDLTGDSVTAETLAEGTTAHDASGNQIIGKMPTTNVLYTEQTLTEAQKAQARENIGAQPVGSYLESTELTSAINTALAQAKASGEFDGADGKSAYAYAKDGGYTGTEADFAAKLAKEYTQPDWNANEGEPGHILNRTHWVETNGMVEILPETETVYDDDDGMFKINAVIPAEVGKKYVVKWNGVEYTATAIDGATLNMLPCPTIINDGANMDTGEGAVFAIFCGGNNGNSYFAMAVDGSTSVTLSVSGSSEVIHPIPGKFLPEGVPYVEQGEMVEVLPETAIALEDNGAAFIDTVPTLIAGNTYIVNWNGTEYTCVAQDLSENVGAEAIAMGNLAEAGFSNTGEPFIIVCSVEMGGTQIGALDGTASTTLTISISGNEEIIHKLDPKFLPDAEPVDDSVFWVTGLFYDSFDHTLDEIGEAFRSGKVVWFRSGEDCIEVSPCIHYTEGQVAVFARYTNNTIQFCKLKPDGTIVG